MAVGLNGIDSQTDNGGLPAGEGKKWAGKFNSAEELENGYQHILTNDAKLSAENEQLRRRLEAVTPLINTPPQTSRSSALDSLAEATATDKEQLANAFYSVAREVVQSELQPLYQEAAARQRVASELPGYEQFEPEIRQFINSNPDVRAEVERSRAGGAHVAAMKYAFNEWRASQPNNGRTSASGNEQAQALLDSATLGGGGAGADRGGLGKPSTGGADPANILQQAILKARTLRPGSVEARRLGEEIAAYVFDQQAKMMG